MSEIWIGLAEVAPHAGNTELGDQAGAYVQVVSPATSAEEYATKAEAALAEIAFNVVEWDDIYVIGPEWPPADAELSLIEAVREARDRGEVSWGNWHTFPREDEQE